MPRFTFEAMDGQGKTVKDEVEAVTQEEAISRIRRLGYFPTSIREKVERGAARRTVAPGKKRALAFGGVSGKQLTLFTRQLATLQDAGLPILRSVRVLQEQLKPGVLKNYLMDVADDIEAGSTFSEALARHPRAFDKLYVNMVRAGEAGGVLDQVLSRLADFREKAARLQRRVLGAMIYPICVLVFATLIVAFVMIWIIPQFKEIFEEFEIDLPAITVGLIAVATFVKTYWWLVFLVIPISVFIAVKLIGMTRPGRYTIDLAKLRIPLLGTIIRKASIGRFTRTLGTLLASGVPILEALNIVKDASGNVVIANAIGSVHDSIREGESMAEPLAQSKVCEAMVVNMVEVGEETGELDRMLVRVADSYDEDVDAAVNGMVSLMEPLLIIGVAVIGGTIVIALFMPLIQLMNSLGE
jgi:type IV pilus assembly protein PilC